MLFVSLFCYRTCIRYWSAAGEEKKKWRLGPWNSEDLLSKKWVMRLEQPHEAFKWLPEEKSLWSKVITTGGRDKKGQDRSEGKVRHLWCCLLYKKFHLKIISFHLNNWTINCIIHQLMIWRRARTGLKGELWKSYICQVLNDIVKPFTFVWYQIVS